MNSTFRQRLLQGELLRGIFVTLGIPETGEILSASGFDWLCIDTEHAPLSPIHVQRIIQGTAGRCANLVRIAAATEVAVKQALDTGADGVIVPLVNSPEETRQVVAWARYAPEGRRGVGLARAHGYGKNFRNYMERANKEIVVVVQAEQREAVEKIREIAAVPGLDGIFVGPYDLSASLGHPGEVDHADVSDAIQRIFAACRDAGKAAGVFGIDAPATRAYIVQGFTLVAAGVDAMVLGTAAADLCQAMIQPTPAKD
ncbi:MAG: aldolase/citrate lyase family protein [Acidobacteriota bacterium]|jgi:2-dehydro-3-deoxyglucarate aldolase/4-hydroxy-2-oxoheptanedioate aldolase|nr:aldolase/citrate lyase family protein [Acidobacteriota bacterium]